MMPIAGFWWYVIRLAIAACLLAFDLRAFLFYAFMVFLVALREVDRLRATVRVLSMRQEVKLLAITDYLEIPRIEFERLFEREQAGPELNAWRQDLERDVQKSTGNTVF
jgi:hypothetical protein